MKTPDNKVKNMVKCAECKKEFLYNPKSIYRIKSGGRFKHYCSYTCWRKAGGGAK